MPDVRKLFLPALLLVVAALALAACGGGGGSSSESTSEGGGETAVTETEGEDEGGASALGSPDKATGKPIVFGLLNIENGPIVFPELREGAEAAINYINEYKGGLQGRPIKLETCATDGQPATSARCANEVIEKDPLLILGGGDTGGPGAIPVYERAEIPYVGGVPFTPVESNSKDAVIFNSFGGFADNLAALAYAHEELGAESGVALGVGGTQGEFTQAVLKNGMEGMGMEVTVVTFPETTADVTSPAAEAVSQNADMVFADDPANCPALLKALESVGNTAPVVTIELCASPQAIEAAGSAAEGVYFAGPYEQLDSGSEAADITAAMLEKYAPKAPVNGVTLNGVSSVMNIANKLNEAPKADLEDQSKILPLFEEGKENPNWLAHPYTCDHKQVPTQSSACTAYQKVKQVKNGEVVEVGKGWVTGTQYYHPSE